jgi:BON domain
MRAQCLILAITAMTANPGTCAEEERRNYFDDPFVQVTSAIANCPKQEGPRITLAEMRAESHSRIERGTRCYEAGRCRLPNAYMYDKEIIPRVEKAILADGRYPETSIWIEGQRRWVWLKGCVRTREQSSSLEALVRSIDDVEAVINQLEIKRR